MDITVWIPLDNPSASPEIISGPISLAAEIASPNAVLIFDPKSDNPARTSSQVIPFRDSFNSSKSFFIAAIGPSTDTMFPKLVRIIDILPKILDILSKALLTPGNSFNLLTKSPNGPAAFPNKEPMPLIMLDNISPDVIQSVKAYTISPIKAVTSRICRLKFSKIVVRTLNANPKPPLINVVNIFTTPNIPLNVLVNLSRESSFINIASLNL